MRKTKKLFAMLLSIIMLLTMSPLMLAEASANNENFYMCLTYPDIQANKTSEDLRYGTNSNHIDWQKLPVSSGYSQVYLSQNEYEGFQAFFYEKSDSRNIDIEVTEFVNESGETLDSAVYNEMYMKIRGSESAGDFAEALIPYNHEGVQTVKNENNMFYIELHSKKNQTPGKYYAKLTISDENGVLTTDNICANVWNFALPENHLSTYLCGLYNYGSGYTTTSGFLRLAGVRFNSDGTVYEEDKALAEEILEGWDNYFLEHGITSYEIPAYLLETDEKAAELSMADPRRSMFMVPLEGMQVENGQVTGAKAVNSLNKYKSIVKGNPILEDKAFFYLTDEPNWSSPDDNTSSYDAKVNAVKAVWGDNYHSIVPFGGSNTAYVEGKQNKLKETTDIFCPNQNTVVASEAVRKDFISGNWHKALRYCGDTWIGNTYVWTWGKSTGGVYARILQWQAAATNTDGMLHWNAGFVNPFFSEGKPFDALKLQLVPGGKGSYPQTENGDGVFAYQGATLGFDPATPIASLRLKWIADGMDDYDYLQLAREFLGEDAYQSYLKSEFPNYDRNDTENKHRIWGEAYKDYDGNGGLDYVSWECTTLQSVRRQMGNALSQANTENTLEHSYSEWIETVQSDATHNGLEIRECSVCGAQESRKTNVPGCDHKEYVSKQAVAATCTSDGATKEISCSICNEVVSPSLVIKATGHRIPVQEGKEATCTEEGYTAAEACMYCDYTKDSTVIQKKPHSYGNYISNNDATCTADGTKTAKCINCDATNTVTDKGSKKAHSEVTVPSVEPTCTKTGLTEGKKCTVCGTITLAQKEVSKKAHTEIIINAVEPTCTKTGLTEGKKCSVCGTVTLAQKEIAKKAHSEITINAVEPTCTKTGLTEGKKCSVCGTVTLAQKEVAKKAHTEITIKAVEPTCTKTGLTEGKKCSICGTVTLAQKEIAKKTHTDSNGDNICDNCGKDMSENPSAHCSCNCHKTGFMGFIYKIQKFFWKLFKTNKTCACGVQHY